MDYLAFLLCLYLSWCLLQTLLFLQKWRNRYSSMANQPPPQPPGPRPLPVLGNLLEIGNLPHKSLAKLAKAHGPIMTLRLGSVTTIVISSALVAREVFRIHDLQLSSRTVPQSSYPFEHNRLSVAWAPVSPLWKTLRRILSSNMFTPKKLDLTRDLRHKKVRDLVERVGDLARAGRPVVLFEEASRTMIYFLLSAICSIDSTRSCSTDKSDELVKLVNKFMLHQGKPNLADYFPVLRRIDPQGIKRNASGIFRELFVVFDGLISKKLQLRQESLNSSASQNCNPDLLDSLLDICEDMSEEIDLHIVKHLMLDLFVAGTDTTTNTLEWAMAELLRHPDKLSKARSELHQAIGKGHQLQESDIAGLPYLHAVLKETLRLHPTVPLLLPRKAEADVVVSGFTIPKGAQVVVNFWAISRDPDSWEEAEKFMPERFLGRSCGIDLKGQHFELIPFGAGRRICPGLALAMKMLQLMLGSLINCFDWRVDGDIKPEEMNMEDKFTITLRIAQTLTVVAVTCSSS